jgi:hypothetical protein
MIRAAAANNVVRGFACSRSGAMRFPRLCHAWREMARLTQNRHSDLKPS